VTCPAGAAGNRAENSRGPEAETGTRNRRPRRVCGIAGRAIDVWRKVTPEQIPLQNLSLNMSSIRAQGRGKEKNSLFFKRYNFTVFYEKPFQYLPGYSNNSIL